MCTLPKTAIILINWNGYEDTAQCIDSLISDRYPNGSIIVVDNNSTDGSLSQLRSEYSNDVDFLPLDKNVGFPSGNNRGIKYALSEHDAEFFFILNNDTIVPDGSNPLIRSLIDTYKSHDSVGIISPLITCYPDKSTIWFSEGYLNPWTGKIDHQNMGSSLSSLDRTGTWNTDIIPGCAMFLHRDLIKEVGLLKESYFIRISDSEFSLRIRNAGYQLLVNSDVVIYHKESSSAGKFGLSYYTARNRWHLTNDTEQIQSTAKVVYFWWFLKAIVDRLRHTPFQSIRLLKGSLAGFRGERGKKPDE